MKKLAMLLVVVLAGLTTATPTEARHHHRAKGKAKASKSCRACVKKSKCACAPDTGYRAAAWGGSWYHTSESCKKVAEIAKEKLVTGESAMYGRRRHCCCGGHA